MNLNVNMVKETFHINDRDINGNDNRIMSFYHKYTPYMEIKKETSGNVGVLMETYQFGVNSVNITININIVFKLFIIER